MEVSGASLAFPYIIVLEKADLRSALKTLVYNSIRFASFCFLIMRELKWFVMKISTALFLEHIKFL